MERHGSALCFPLGVLCLASLFAGGGCSGEVPSFGGDAAVVDGGPRDGGGEGGSPKLDGGGPCPGNPCPAGFVCHQGKCFADGGPCAKDDECIGDTYCEEGRCLPYGKDTKQSDPDCKGGGFTAEKLEAPVVKCSWETGPVISAPVVIDLDGDKVPEILFVAFKTGALVAIRGDTCQEVFHITTAKLGTRSQLAVADLDGDGKPEIMGVDGANKIVIFDNKGVKLASSPAAAMTGP